MVNAFTCVVNIFTCEVNIFTCVVVHIHVCSEHLDWTQVGRACWMLAPEGEGEELDVSADSCRIVK